MAEQELAQSLSEEESELLLPPSQPSSSKPKKKQLSSGSSPTRSPKEGKGYKFNAEQQKLTGADFDFASQSKNGGGGANNSHSSSDGEDLQDFEILTPSSITPDGEMNGGGDAKAPLSPSKLPTPHKRTAELADTGGDVGTTGHNGSPPSSPAPKKHKAWQEYVAEDEARRSKEKGGTSTEGTGRSDLEPLGIGKGMAIFVVIALPILAGLIMVRPDLIDFGQMTGYRQQNAVAPPSTPPQYSWRNAEKHFIKGVKKLEGQFPKQNRETWIQLISSITSTLSESQPEHPAPITILLPPTLPSSFATCFTSKIAKLLNTYVAPILQNKNDTKSASAHPPKVISPKTFEGSSTLTDIRKDLDHYLSTGGKAIIVEEVDKIKKEEDLMLFHGLCDNFLAVDKRATILFPLKVPQKTFEKYEWIHARGGDISTDVLNEAFGKVVSADTGPALVARIADAVILLNDGDNC